MTTTLDITTSGSFPSCRKCLNIVAFTVIYSSAANNIQSYDILSTLRACFIPFMPAAVKSVFPTYTSSLYRPVAKTGITYIDAVICV